MPNLKDLSLVDNKISQFDSITSDRFPSLQRFLFSQDSELNDQLQFLEKFSHLADLSIIDTKLHDSDFEAISSMKQITHLKLENTNISN